MYEVVVCPSMELFKAKISSGCSNSETLFTKEARLKLTHLTHGKLP